MTENRCDYILPRLPETWNDQLKSLPQDIKERTRVTAIFHQEVNNILTEANIPIINSFYRAKTDESIQAKLSRRLLRNRNNPIADIYGTRFIVQESLINTAVQKILKHFEAPKKYPWGMLSVIDHRKPEIRSNNSSKHYKAVHIYVPFGKAGVKNIGDIQLLTPEWMKTANRTKRHYYKRQGRQD